MPLTDADRELLDRCLRQEPGAWNDFVDRYVGLIYHVIQSTAHLRNVSLRPDDVEDVAAEVLVQLIAKDFAALRQFKGLSSLAAYLTVISRRACVHELARRAASREGIRSRPAAAANQKQKTPARDGLETLEQVQKMLKKLPPKERQVVRLHFLDGMSYEEISAETGIPINSIGPILTRAKQKLREGSDGAAS